MQEFYKTHKKKILAACFAALTALLATLSPEMREQLSEVFGADVAPVNSAETAPVGSSDSAPVDSGS